MPQNGGFAGTNYDMFYPQHMQPLTGFNTPANPPQMMLFDHKDQYGNATAAAYDTKAALYATNTDGQTSQTPAAYNPQTMPRAYENMSNYFASQQGFVNPYAGLKSPYMGGASDSTSFSAAGYTQAAYNYAMGRHSLKESGTDVTPTSSSACALQKAPYMTSPPPQCGDVTSGHPAYMGGYGTNTGSDDGVGDAHASTTVLRTCAREENTSVSGRFIHYAIYAIPYIFIFISLRICLIE